MIVALQVGRRFVAGVASCRNMLRKVDQEFYFLQQFFSAYNTEICCAEC